MKRTGLLMIGIMLCWTAFARAQMYEPTEIKSAYRDGTRSRSGKPGENYWQNHSDYTLKANFDPQSRVLHGSGTITYTNNSPDTLKYLVIKLLPNIHKKGNARDFTVGPERLNEGMVLESMSINSVEQDLDNHKKFREYGTNLYVIFDRSEYIPPQSSHDISVSWHYKVIMNGIRNGGFTDSAFFIGYWYPQVAVYDDVYGWDREDYTGGQETYNDLATYKVEISLPGDYMVWSTGDQSNEQEIFTEDLMELIEKSRQSSEVINIITGETYEKGNIFLDNEKHTWKFKAENVPDFAWACSNYYNWDASNLELDNGRNIWISAVYPPGSKNFNEVAAVAHQAIDYLSRVFPGVPYPFNKHTTFNGIHHVAVEYPMMANNSDHASVEMYTELTIHEIAHNYIPFYMLSNERKHAWIDEGWVKLIGELHGETLGFMRENKTALNTVAVYERIAGTSDDLPLIVPSGNMTVRYNFFHSYAKAANSNLMLMKLMEEKGIENPLKEFITAWAGKHPTPYDFFYYMNTLCGEDLSWFWNPWYFDFSAPDLSIKKSTSNNEVMVLNEGGIPLPVTLTVTYKDGQKIIIEKSIWSWADGKDQLVIPIAHIMDVTSITLGSPDIPDINEENNVLDLQATDLGKL